MGLPHRTAESTNRKRPPPNASRKNNSSMNMHTARPLHTAVRRLGFALALSLLPAAHGVDFSYNTGSLGASSDGTNSITLFGTALPTLDQPGVVAAYGDYSTAYSGGNVTSVAYRPELNPASNLPFTIEFWARPTSSTNNNSPVSCRVSAGNRSGWAFFQRAAGTGWNFVMYNGTSSQRGWDLTGGTANLNQWSHVVAVWNGSVATLYVNGALINATNAPNGAVAYNASTSAVFSVGNLNDSNSPFNGLLDEIAFYPTALTATKIANHYAAASNSTPGFYSSMVIADGASLYLQQNPPFVTISDSGANKTITFTGILSQSPDLSPSSWVDLLVNSPHIVTPSASTPQMFFRVRR